MVDVQTMSDIEFICDFCKFRYNMSKSETQSLRDLLNTGSYLDGIYQFMDYYNGRDKGDHASLGILMYFDNTPQKHRYWYDIYSRSRQGNSFTLKQLKIKYALTKLDL